MSFKQLKELKDSFQITTMARRKIKQIDQFLKDASVEKNSDQVIELQQQRILALQRELERIDRKQRIKQEEIDKIKKEKEILKRKEAAKKSKELLLMSSKMYFDSNGKSTVEMEDVKPTLDDLAYLSSSTKAQYDRAVKDKASPNDLIILADFCLQVIALANETKLFNVTRNEERSVLGEACRASAGYFTSSSMSLAANNYEYDVECSVCSNCFSHGYGYVPQSVTMSVSSDAETEDSYSDIDTTGFVIV